MYAVAVQFRVVGTKMIMYTADGPNTNITTDRTSGRHVCNDYVYIEAYKGVS